MVRDCCEDTAAAAVAETTGVPLFNCNENIPILDAKFSDWKKRILTPRSRQGDTLVITSFYRADENNGEQLARTRAEALRDNLAPEVPKDRIILNVRDTSAKCADLAGKSFESASFSWRAIKVKKEESAIIESDKDVILLFPFNSKERERDAKVEAYLKELCAKHKTTTATFNLVGHTDNVGTDEENVAMGLARAKTVAGSLTRNGIAANRINTSSKGESEPVADNSTDEGRQQNRRVVIPVNQ